VRSARPSAVAATALLLLGPCAPLARAQSTSPVDGITPLGLAPGRPAGSFPLSGFESVNLFGGNLSFALPLLRVEGRGEAGFTMHLAVERRWSLRLTNPRKQHGEPDRYAAEWDWGVKPGYSPGTLYQRSATQRVSVDPVSFMVTHQETLTRLSFRRGDGTEHDLRDDLTEGQLKVWWEGKAPFDRGVRWHATDGSAASFVSDAPIRDPGATPLGTRPVVGGRLLLADGTEYRIGTGTGGAPGRVTRIRDRNGNTVRLEYADGALVRVTDPLGRVSTITYRRAGEPWEDEIRYGGYGGADRSVVVRHRRLGECLVEGESLRSYPELFPTLTMADPSAFDPRVACEVELPNGTRYDLAYNAWGELVRVTLPTGGRIEYEWGSGAESEHGLLSLGSGGDGRVWAYAVARRVTSRRVWNYGQLEQWAEYDASECRWGDCRVEVRHLDADGTLVSRERHSFRGSPLASFGLEPCDYPAWTDGQLESVETYDAAGNRLRRVEQTWAQRAGLPWSSPGTLVRGEPPNDVRLVKTVTTLDDDLAHRAVVRYEHDDYNNVTLREERGHGGGVVRRTERTYVAGPYAQEPVHVRDLLAVEDVRDGAGERRSRTVFEYDDYGPGGLLERPGIVGWEDVGRTARGNLTAVRRWLDRPGRSDPSTEALTRRRYDVAGNPWREIDPEGRAVTWHFDDNYGRADGSLGGGVDHRTFARVTLVRDALGHETRTQFDYETGLPVDQRDRTGLVTRLEYDDPLDRLSFVERGANLPDATRRARTGFTYTDGRWRREVLTHEDQWTSGDAERKTRVLYDELGREWQTGRKAPHPQPWIVVDRRYDARGRLSHVSNPWAEGQGEGPAWTLTRYDAIDRPVEVETPDGAVVATAYSGPTVTVTDAAERQRTSTTDALGRVVEVVEYPDGHAPSRTSYTYDALDHLTGVRQGPQQSRSFLYDSLGRLREAGNPESGLVRYEYDRSGLLVWRRDARGVETSHAYDGLGRERHRAYTDGTPAVSFAWDDDPGGVLAASPWSAGRLVSVDNGVSRSEWRHGPHGHVESSLQRTAGRVFRFDYVTDFAGNVLEQRYPSGRVVTTEVDKLDRVVSVVDAAGLALSDVSYAPHGAATSLRLGNGLVETTRFNLRLQPERVAVGSPTSRLPLLSLDYRYWPEGAPAQRNDGNVWLQRVGVAVPRMELATHTVRYGYDGANRLASASEEGSWSQHYRYDRWGNRAVTGDVPEPALTPRDPEADFDPATNRLRLGSAGYDAAGNLVTDPLGRSITYDAENRQTAFGAGPATDGQLLGTSYAYDSEGRRVLSHGPRGRTLFVYDALGRLAAEYSDTAPPHSGTHYLTRDPLGSVRIVTDQSGRVVSRHDYLPFGEEVPRGFGARADMDGYGPPEPALRHRFTGKERDAESGLDYFGARYLSAAQGRFTGADPANAGARPLEPQSWNAYAYVLNNPLRYVDPDGEAAETVWDAANIAMGVASLVSNVKAGHTGAAALDAVGVIVDVAAAAVPFVPGGAGAIIKGVRAADKAADVVQAADKVADAAKAVDNLVGAASDAAKFVPNPGGRLGGVAHRGKVAEVTADVQSRGLEAVPELKVSTPGGHKSIRYVDVAGRDPVTKEVVEPHQVGKQTRGGVPVSREGRALDDIKAAKVCGSGPCFHPYNE
jgi:RHS repeat-associated protein